MKWQPSFAPLGLVAALLAGVAPARMEAQPAASDAAMALPGGWELRDFDAQSNYHTLTISHSAGRDRIEYSIDVLGHSAGPVRPAYQVEAQSRLSCRSEEVADVGNAAPADRGRLTHALLDRALVALEAECVGPGQRNALLAGFDGAYAALMARYEQVRPVVDAADAAMTDDQRNQASQERSLNTDSMNMDAATHPPRESGAN